MSGGWSDVGAAAGIGRTKTELLTGMRMFTPTQGILALETIMTNGHVQTGVSDVTDWNLFKAKFCLGHYLDEMKSDKNSDQKVDLREHLVAEIKDAKSIEELLPKLQLYVELVLKEILGLSATEEVLDVDKKFQQFGMDSLMSMDMRNKFQPILGPTNLSIGAMQEHCTIRSLCKHISDLLKVGSVEGPSVTELILQDVILPSEVRPAGIPAEKPSKFQNVLLTGATGHIGVYCLVELMKHRPDLTIYCLVRGKSNAEAQGRLLETLNQFSLISKINHENIQVVAGDISKPRLGLSEETYTMLAAKIDGIMHCAAKVNHVEKYSEEGEHDIRSHNVLGLVNVLKLASFYKTKPLLFASSVICCT